MKYAQIRERDAGGKFIKPTIPSGFDKKEYWRQYHIKNRKKKTQYAAEWGRKNKGRSKEIKDKWRAKNRERTNFLSRRYIYRKKHALGTHTLEQIKSLYRQFPTCIYCQINKPNTIDHIIPLSRGGTNNIENLLPVCVSCNSKKGAKTLYEFHPYVALHYFRLRSYA